MDGGRIPLLHGLQPFRIVGATTPFHRMRLVATLLLVAMALAWVAVLAARPRFPQFAAELGYARSFFEAAMIGGLADWFAVTALFRHPLGLPIPHTAIIPSNKDRIGDSLAVFLKDNFLTPSVVARRLEDFDLAGALGRWLTAPPVAAADAKAGRLRQALSKLLLQFADALDGPTMAQLLGVTVTDRLRDRPVAPLLARLLRPLLASGRHEAVVEGLLAAAMGAVDARQDDIHAAVAARAPKYMPGFVDRGYASAFIDGVQDHLFAMTEEAADMQRRDAGAIAQNFRERLAAHEGTGAPPAPPIARALGREHPDRVAITAWLHGLADALDDPASNAARQVEAAKLEILDAPATAALFGSLWETVRKMLAEAVTAPPGEGRGRIALAAGEVVLGNRALADAINTLARRTAVSVVGSYGDAIVRLVSDTIRGWDAATVTDKLETAVGRDLQYIRINGTVIGGLVGLAIHAVGAAV